MDNTIALRPAAMTDAATLERIVLRSAITHLKGLLPASLLVTAVPIIARVPPDLLQAGQVILAERDGQVVGAAGWSHQPPSGQGGARGVAHLRLVFVNPNATRQGIASTLIDHVMADARQAGMNRMQVQAPRPLRPFFEATGFSHSRDAVVSMPGGLDLPVSRLFRAL